MNNIHQKLWCLKSVRAPGIVSQKRFQQHPNFQLENFISGLVEARKFYRDNKFLNAESALLERCIYRMKLKFRSNKGFKALQKILKSLKMYMIVDMAEIIDQIIQINNENNKILYVPGKCNVEYLLIRLQTVAKLMERVIETTKESALYMHSVIEIGHIWKVLIVCLGVISRLRANAINILKYTCNCYLQIKDFYNNYYDDTDKSWVPSQYIFPNDLKEWIGLEWFNQECTSEKKINSIFTMDHESDLFVSEDDENGESVDEEEIVNTELTSNTMHRNILPKQDLEDVGEIVDRKELVKSQLINKKLQNQSKKQQDISNYGKSRRGDNQIAKKRKKKLKEMKMLLNNKRNNKN